MEYVLALKKKKNFSICDNISICEPWRQHTKWNVSHWKANTALFHLYVEYQISQTHQVRELNGGCQGWGEGAMGTC